MAGHRRGRPHPHPGPTGSGKTLAAFLWGIDRLVTSPPPDDREQRTRLALHLAAAGPGLRRGEEPAGPARWASAWRPSASACPSPSPPSALRTGDTPARDRQALVRRPPDLLITTPESLYLMLTSSARDTLRGVEAVIVDEIHALATTKRGAHLMLRSSGSRRSVRRAAAAHRPVGHPAAARGGGPLPRRLRRAPASPAPSPSSTPASASPSRSRSSSPSRTWASSASPPTELTPAARPLGVGLRKSIWPSVYPQILARGPGPPLHDHLLQRPPPGRAPGRPPQRARRRPGHRGARRRRPGQGPPRLAGPRAAGRHRGPAEAGRAARRSWPRPALELGIDMGAVDLVIQVESPGAVSTGLQRIGRAGHSVGEPSRGKVFPKHRGDLLEATVVARRMQEGLIESTRYLRNPLDVLAQQIVATTAMDEWSRRRPGRPGPPQRRLRRPHRRRVLGAPLDLLAGRYPSATSSASCAPASCGTASAAGCGPATAPAGWPSPVGGTIPDRGLFGVFLPDGTRVGELDEEMVYESRTGRDLPARSLTWRIEDITFERVVVTPAPGQPGKMPFWHGDRPGRPLELGRALGAFVRDMRALAPEQAAAERCGPTTGSTPSRPATSCRSSPSRPRPPAWCPTTAPSWSSASATRSATGACACSRPSARRCTRRGPWPSSTGSCERYGVPVETMWSDDGIVIRLPESADELPVDELLVDPDEIDELVVSALPQHVAVRGPLPGGRRPGPAAAPPPSRLSAPRCGSSASGPPTCWRWRPSTRASRSCSRPAGSACRTCSTCRRLRTVLADLRSRADPARQRRHRQGVAVRPEPAVQLDRRLHVRGRRAAGRAAGRGAGPRPRPAARAARRRGAARAHRPRRAGRPRARAAVPQRRAAGPLGRRGPRPAAPPRRPVAGRDRPAQRRRAGRDGRGSLSWSPSGAPSLSAIAGEERYAAAEDAARLPRRPRRVAARRPAGGLHRARGPSARAPRRPLRPHPRAVPRPPPSPRRLGTSAERVAGRWRR